MRSLKINRFSIRSTYIEILYTYNKIDSIILIVLWIDGKHLSLVDDDGDDDDGGCIIVVCISCRGVNDDDKNIKLFSIWE